MRYIGSKTRLLPYINKIFSEYIQETNLRIGDVFCGLGSVSLLFKEKGHTVVANDNLMFCYIFAVSLLKVNSDPLFQGLFQEKIVSRDPGTNKLMTPYEKVLHYLNNIQGESGFIYREYSAGGTNQLDYSRLYFSDENARKIDAIRQKISLWKTRALLTEPETCLLIADLIRATNRIANIAGTYGCFLKYWDARALNPLYLECTKIFPSSKEHEVFQMDANELVKNNSFDVLYLDPPYNWRHYGAYYHILESIAEGDEPIVSGKTGLRPWESSKSRYSNRGDAACALRELVTSAQCKHILLSYNSEGLITHKEIMDILNLRGVPICHEISYRRYRSNNGGSKENYLKERLYYVQCEK